MQRKIAVTFLIIVCYLLQTTLFQALSFANISPNLLIIVASCFGFMRGKKEGMYIGFFCGLIIDIFFGKLFGFYALIYMYIGYLNGFFHKLFFPEDIKLPILLITISDLVYNMMIFITMFLLRNRLDLPYYFIHVMLPEAIYTVLVTILIYRFISKLNQKLEEIEKRSASKFV